MTEARFLWRCRALGAKASLALLLRSLVADAGQLTCNAMRMQIAAGSTIGENGAASVTKRPRHL
jgi:hypothetical protein